MKLRHRHDDTRHDQGHKTREQRQATAYGREDKPERFGPDAEVQRRSPDTPTDLPKRSWGAVLKGALKEFKKDELADRAAALTYYGILALFPALLALISLLGIVGRSATQQVLDNIQNLAPGAARDVLTNAVRQMQGNAGLGSIMAIVGLALAVWSASGYVAAFIRSANAVYDVPEGRPVWKVLPLRLGVTVVLTGPHPRRGTGRARRRGRPLHPHPHHRAPSPGGRWPGRAGRLPAAARLAGRNGDAHHRQDPGEHGAGPQHPARTVGLDARPGHPLHHLGVGLPHPGRRLEAHPQRPAPHLDQRGGPRP
ncbi:YhjD/YihY/BrkB family envelope integrity protein [Streptomyces sp. NPDC012510]|uniref:YihY/virulence factor BrkB family protein n=1 Tax=Streptomyces sp. NPDC012510 TaxID=3364838 RepID=UPI0036E5978E